MLPSKISASEPDWSRERCAQWWNPGQQLLKSIRDYQTWRKRNGILSRFIVKYSVLRHRFWSVIAGADIPLNCQIQGGLLMPHPNGIVIHPEAVIGPNCLILQQVTIVAGVRIGGHVDIGAGAKVIRPVSIDDHARVGANALVLCHVPAGGSAVGIPARVITKSELSTVSLPDEPETVEAELELMQTNFALDWLNAQANASA